MTRQDFVAFAPQHRAHPDEVTTPTARINDPIVTYRLRVVFTCPVSQNARDWLHWYRDIEASIAQPLLLSYADEYPTRYELGGLVCGTSTFGTVEPREFLVYRITLVVLYLNVNVMRI